MPIFTTAVSGSGTNRHNGLEQGGIASHFTGSIHIFSGSFPGQMGLNITGSALATAGVYTSGIYAWHHDGADAQVMSFSSVGDNQVDFLGDIKLGTNKIRNSEGEATINLDADQRVGIGGISPTYKLDVNGDIRVRGNDIRDNSGGVAIQFDGSANTTVVGDLTVSGGDAAVKKTGSASANVTLTRYDSGGLADGADIGAIRFYGTENDSDISQMGYVLVEADENFDWAGSATGARLKFGLCPDGQKDAPINRMELDNAGNLQIDGSLQVDGNIIQDSGGNAQITFSAGSKATFGYDIETAGTASVSMLQVGTSVGNPIGTNNAGYPLRVSNDSTQDGSKSGVLVDTRDTETVGAFAFEKNGNIGGGNQLRRGWYYDWSANANNALSFRKETDPQAEGGFVIHGNGKGARVGGGQPLDNSDWVDGLLVTGSDYASPSEVRIRSHFAERSVQGVPMLSWQYEMTATENNGFWTMGVSPLCREDDDARDALVIGSPSPGTSYPTHNYRAVTIQSSGINTKVGIGGKNGTVTHAYGDVRSMIPTGSLHVENQRSQTYALDRDLKASTLLLGNSNNSSGEVAAGIYFDVARESNTEKHTAHILAVNTDTADGHTGYLAMGLYDGSTNVDSTRMRFRIDDQGGALFISGTQFGANSGWPKPDGNYWSITDLDIPSGSITCVSLMDGTHNKDAPTINLVSWGSTATGGGAISAGDNLGRISWWSSDPDIDDAGESYKQTAAYIEATATVDHSNTNFAVGQLDFYARGAGISIPKRVMTLTGDATPKVEVVGNLTVSGGDINGGTNNDLYIRSDRGIILHLDEDESGTAGNHNFRVRNGADTQVMELSEAGELEIAGALKTAAISYTDGDGAIAIYDGGTIEYKKGSQFTNAVKVNSTHSDTNSAYWVQFAESWAVGENSDSASAVFLVEMSGLENTASYSVRHAFIVWVKYNANMSSASRNNSDSTYIIVEPIDGSDLNGFDPTTMIKLEIDNDMSSKLWFQAPSGAAGMYKNLFVSYLGAGIPSGHSNDSVSDYPWKISIDQSWVSSPTAGQAATIVGQYAEKVFSKVTADFLTSLTTNITLDAAGDIILSADGDQITMDDGTTTRFTFNVDSSPELDIVGNFRLDGDGTMELDANGAITLDPADNLVKLNSDGVESIGFDVGNQEHYFYAPATVNDYFKIDVNANGATTLATQDNDGAVGHMTLDADGDIILSTDSVSIGTGTATDTKIVFDGNAQDYYVGLDDTDDKLKIGLGSAVGTTPAAKIGLNSSSDTTTFIANTYEHVQFVTTVAASDTSGSGTKRAFSPSLTTSGVDFDNTSSSIYTLLNYVWIAPCDGSFVAAAFNSEYRFRSSGANNSGNNDTVRINMYRQPGNTDADDASQWTNVGTQMQFTSNNYASTYYGIFRASGSTHMTKRTGVFDTFGFTINPSSDYETSDGSFDIDGSWEFQRGDKILMSVVYDAYGNGTNVFYDDVADAYNSSTCTLRMTLVARYNWASDGSF